MYNVVIIFLIRLKILAKKLVRINIDHILEWQSAESVNLYITLTRTFCLDSYIITEIEKNITKQISWGNTT